MEIITGLLEIGNHIQIVYSVVGLVYNSQCQFVCLQKMSIHNFIFVMIICTYEFLVCQSAKQQKDLLYTFFYKRFDRCRYLPPPPFSNFKSERKNWVQSLSWQHHLGALLCIFTVAFNPISSPCGGSNPAGLIAYPCVTIVYPNIT